MVEILYTVPDFILKYGMSVFTDFIYIYIVVYNIYYNVIFNVSNFYYDYFKIISDFHVNCQS